MFRVDNTPIHDPNEYIIIIERDIDRELGIGFNFSTAAPTSAVTG